MAKKRRIRWDRVAVVAVPILLIIFLLVKCGGGSNEKQKPSGETSRPSFLYNSTTQPADQVSVPDEFIVMIDAGHGGKDGGATNKDGSRLEKDDNLRLSLATRDALLQYPHVKVLMTREDDTFISVYDRPKIANEANVDLFVSLHRNTATVGHGVEIWYNESENTDLDRKLAEYIMELLEKVGISDNRGVRVGSRGSGTGDDQDDGYIVNRDTTMPSCLVEMGFMSSDADNRNFDEHLNEYAKAIAEAIVDVAKDNKLYQPDALT